MSKFEVLVLEFMGFFKLARIFKRSKSAMIFSVELFRVLF